jgi:hypothetical protein
MEAMRLSGTWGLSNSGDSQLLGEFSQARQYANMRELEANGHALSQNGLQTGTQEAILDTAGICGRI